MIHHSSDVALAFSLNSPKPQFKFPYSLGPLNNLRSVLGASPLTWCWPRSMVGDGLAFPTSSDVGQWESAVGGRTVGGDTKQGKDEDAGYAGHLGLGEGRRRLDRPDDQVQEMEDLV